ncbi:hypothetical protein PENANT_c118G09217 [Penicillium antarcticum]|uniref:MARVEL domain-containing protein n=1 Tax=Penicillium antarcticum TaxID=416450 RepID=A0A1V6PJ89_9EURO|nr:uncharacterized protein N7508_011039 [Penicillium antarcticum]KAJ5288264.1 hypothetical protein N7508_011039 [Penicillium antarcticum]OQD76767.1 hypothetical protein PENANT_c118G09217 [Penicillium antarcticum]
MSTKYTIRMRLAIAFLAIIGLAFASLNSAMARFAIILRDRAKADIITPNKSISDNTFRNLMDNVLVDVLIAVVISTSFAVVGAVLACHPRWLRGQDRTWMYFGCFQCILSLVILSTGGYLADHVHGFQTSFERVSGNDNFQYYKIMFFGGVGQAAYGSLVIFMAIASFVAFLIYERHERETQPIEATRQSEQYL